MKQTAVEWFFEQLEFNESVSRYELLEQAKQMHKQEIIESHEDGGFLLVHQSKRERAEKYYKNTYEKE